MADRDLARECCDSARKPSHVLALWIVPGLVAAAAFLAAVWLPWLLLLGATACVVMGVACVVNASRSRRLHCYLTGPYFLLLAFAAAVAFVFDARDAHRASVWLLVALAFAPLLVWLPERIAGVTYRKSSASKRY